MGRHQFKLSLNNSIFKVSSHSIMCILFTTSDCESCDILRSETGRRREEEEEACDNERDETLDYGHETKYGPGSVTS